MNSKLFYLSLFLIFTWKVNAQITAISQSLYTVQAFSSDNSNHPVAHAFDGLEDSWWAIYNSEGFSLPAVVELDLGTDHNLAGFSYLPNPASTSAKALSYEIYSSGDGTSWDSPEARGSFHWENGEDVSLQTVQFGAVAARYVKVVFPTSQNTSNGNIHTNELVLFKSDTPATGQQNQLLTIEAVPEKITTDPDFELTATASSGQPVSFEILSGPAMINGNMVSLTGEGGKVEVKAKQEGDDTYYPVEALLTFEVIDLSVFYPTISTRLSEDYPIQMDVLSPYPIYIQANIDPHVGMDYLEIEIAGETFQATEFNGFYYYLWTPSAYGVHSISIKAFATNGNSITETRNVTVSNEIAGQTVTTMDDVVIWYGRENSRWFYEEYALPQHLGVYDRIIAHLNIECPDNNCDDWDRLAYIDVKGPDGNWIQIIRYITPYGVACTHDLDVTDYASLLQGDVEFRMFIDTWGTGGWQVTLDLEYQMGTPDYRYSRVEEIWDKAYDLGNPANLQPVDTIDFKFAGNIQKSVLRLSNTGHGWGENNSQNAAEFYHATHYIDIDHQQKFTQDLWNDCNPNPDGCTGQQGTWYHSRAGWCPGAISSPDVFDLSSNINQNNITVTYRFDPSYVDYCHPNNPSCFSGFTCPDCNDGYKAVNHVDGQIINFSNTPLTYDTTTDIEIIDNTEIYGLTVFPSPTKGAFRLNCSADGAIRLRIFTIDGKQIKAYHFKSEEALNNYSFDLSDQEKGTYFISLESDFGTGTAKVVVQ